MTSLEHTDTRYCDWVGVAGDGRIRQI